MFEGWLGRLWSRETGVIRTGPDAGPWDPPGAPEDKADHRFAPVPQSLAKPAKLADAEYIPVAGLPDQAVVIGSIWRLSQPAAIVSPQRLGHRITLALLKPKARPDRYTLATGSRLRLVRAYEPSRDPQAQGLDQALYYGYYGGNGYRAYQVLDGLNAGREIELPAGDGPFFLPPSALAAHISLLPEA